MNTRFARISAWTLSAALLTLLAACGSAPRQPAPVEDRSTTARPRAAAPTEAGAPTALMELAYRLAVDESDYIKHIRNNVITLITPVVEPDGRDHEQPRDPERPGPLAHEVERLGVERDGRGGGGLVVQ